jgi:hypothetical protein
MLSFAFDHLVAADSGHNESLQHRAAKVLETILLDWNQNRYPGDPNLDGTYVSGQNLAWRFKQLARGPARQSK